MEMARLADDSIPPSLEKPAELIREQHQEIKKEKQKLERSKEKIESEILFLTEKIKEIEVFLAKEDSSNYQKIDELDKSLQNFKKKLLACEEIWLEIESQLLKI
jgi:predicted nuclease with TOPRIM domain